MDSTFSPKLKLFLTYTLTLISFIYSDNCISYTCSALESNLCLRLNTTIESSISVSASSCKQNSEFCPSFKLSSQQEVKCEVFSPLKVRQYPGGPCKTSDDCINNSECKESKCVGFAENTPCERHDQCLFALACFRNSTDSDKKFCQKLRPSGANNCESEFECQMNQGCFSGVCTDYYSLHDKTYVGANKAANTHSFCTSGHDLHGVCDSLKSINSENQTVSDLPVKCDETNPCSYLSLNGTISEAGLCKCGKNKDGARLCPVFGGNKHFKAAVKQIKDSIASKNENCNTIERHTVCNFLKLNNANDASVLTYETLKAKINYYHEFAQADECVKKIFYPQYNKDYDVEPADTTGKKCPVFRCSSENNSENKICARNTFDEKQNKTFVDLFKKSCDFSSESCNFDRNYLDKETKDFTCAAKDSNKKRKAYPGEACKNDQDCFLLNGEAVEGLGKCLASGSKCSGFDLNANCTHSSQCNSGLYCKSKDSNSSSSCQKQEDVGANCSSTFDCKNGLVCFNKKCGNGFFSVKVGETFSAANVTEADLKEIPAYLCKFNLLKVNDKGEFVCLMKNQTDASDSQQGNLVPCIPDQTCNYTLTDEKAISTEKKENCECGFNSNGQGYCKAGHNYNTDSWDQLVNEKRDSLNNNCHSMGRFDCNEVSNSDRILSLTKKTEELNLFYNAESCALQVLSANALKISTLIIALIIAFIF